MKALLRLTTLVAMTTACIVTPSAAQGPALRAGISQPSYRYGSNWEPSFKQDKVQPNQWKKGALIGAGVGAVAGSALFLLAEAIAEESVNPMVFFGPVLAGAVVGAIIGSGVKK